MEAVASVSDNWNWQVLWVVRQQKGKRVIARVVKKDFDGDLAGALVLYTKAVQAGKKGATLRCKNIGFAPPEDKRPYTETRKFRDRRGKIVRRDVDVNPMEDLNHMGAYWCPYCIKFRKFEKRSRITALGTHIEEPGLYCPICGISHRNHLVRRYNPIVLRIAEDFGPTTRRPRSTTRRRRR